MRAAVFCLVLWGGCTPADDDDDDPPVSETEDTEVAVETDTDPVDETDDTDLDAACSDSEPDGWCPSGTACVQGRCLVDLDPGDPVGDLPDRWRDFAVWAADRDLHADDGPVDWATVQADVASDLASAKTAFEAAWIMTEGVARLRNGHVHLQMPAICDVAPRWWEPSTDSGACLTQAEDGSLFVYDARPDTDWRPGDRLLSLDGRSTEDLIDDALAQPRCILRAPRDDTRRATAVASLLLRGARNEQVEVEGLDGQVRTFERPNDPSGPPCVHRVPPATETALGSGVFRTDLDGGVVSFYLAELGDFSMPQPTPDPVIDVLRSQLSALPPDTPVIFDLRGTQGGFAEVVDQIAAWILPGGTTLRTCLIRVGDAPGDIGGPFDVDTTADTWSLDGPIAVLVDAHTYGTPELLSLALADHALLVGTPSYGSYGLSVPYPDPQLGAVIEGRRCQDALGASLEGRPPALDLEVRLSPEDVAAGVDSVLEAARSALLQP